MNFKSKWQNYKANRIFFALSLVSLLSGISGCETLDEYKERQERIKIEKENASSELFRLPAEYNADKSYVEESLTNDKNVHDDLIEPLNHLDPKVREKVASLNKDLNVKVVRDKALEKVSKAKTPFYMSLISKGDPLKKISIRFNAATIADIIPVFSRELNFSYIIDPAIQGAVTMSLDDELKESELWQMFEQILTSAGAYCTLEDNIVHIKPITSMPGERLMLTGSEEHANVETQIFPIKNASAKDVLVQILPFMTKGASAIELMRQNAVVIVETPKNMNKIRELINILDRKNKAGWSQSVIQCYNMNASQIRNELSEIMPVLGFPINIGELTNDPGAIHLISVDRLQVIVASAANDEALNELKRWTSLLDRADVGEQERVYIYNVVNNSAQDLASVLSVVFEADGNMLEINKDSQNKSTKNLPTAKGKNNNNRSLENGTKNIPEAQGANIFEQQVKVFADAVHNRLVIRTTPRTYAMVKAILQRLDTVPSQVLLKVIVLEVTLDKNTELGLEFGGKAGGSVWNINWDNLQPNNENPQSGGTLNYDSDSFMAYLRAVAGKNNLRVISSPQLVVKNNSTAKIKVGQQVPLIQSTLSEINNPNSYNRTYNYEDTGIIFEVTPEINKGDLISLEMSQTVSSAKKNTLTIDSQALLIQERVIETSLSLRNNRTLIVGGLIQENIEENLSSLPWIADVPFLNWIFGDNQRTESRTEMLVLITAKIVKEDSKLEDLVKRYQDSAELILNFESSNRERAKKIRQRQIEDRERKVWWE
ncbi:secretin N-terminal domain-containing protein [Lentisphaerota bacterium WC36G]|nr:hypothetical protein LJT99_03235 [Lentisphaerae bacterium WC36]